MSRNAAVPASEGRLRSWIAEAWARLRRPLWHEPPRERSRRWQRLVLHGPIGMVVGGCFGVLAATGGTVVPALASAAAGLLVMYLLGHAESFLRLRPRARGGIPPAVLRIGADLIGGGVLGWALSQVLDTHAAASLLAGASLFAGYSYVVGHLLWGDVLDGIVRFASGNAASRRPPDFSREKALAARGRVDEALELYEGWCELRKDDPEPMIQAAWMLREARRPEEALVWYRRALDRPNLDADGATRIVRHIWEIAATRLDDPGLALADLERLVREHPRARRHEWVRREIRELRDQPSSLPP